MKSYRYDDGLSHGYMPLRHSLKRRLGEELRIQLREFSIEGRPDDERQICSIACAVLNTLLRCIFFVLVMAIGLSRIVVLVIFL